MNYSRLPNVIAVYKDPSIFTVIEAMENMYKICIFQSMNRFRGSENQELYLFV